MHSKLVTSVRSFMSYVLNSEGLMNTAMARCSLVILVAAISIEACNDQTTGPANVKPAGAVAPVNGVAPSASLFGSDAKFAQIATQIPGFGGLFYDSTGTPTAYLVDMTSAQTAQSVLLPLLADAKRAIVFRHGTYNFLELSNWKEALSPKVLAIPGVVFLDADEARNRVRIGVATLDAESKVTQLAALLGVPKEALIIETMSPASISTITVRDLNTPRAGGFQINWGTSAQYLCTIGPNAYFAGDTTKAYGVVNSHCTNVQGQIDGTNYYQPLQSTPFSFIGTEMADPIYWVGGQCPSGQRCRTSDAALFKYAVANPPIYQVGYIARTTSSDGSIFMNTSTPRFKITKTGNWPWTGLLVFKVGRTTGWTVGLVTSTCVDTPQYENGRPTGITMLCSDYVFSPSNPGDSGSPVFTLDSSNNATLEGILWGNDGNGDFIMSPVQNIKNELGNLVFNAP